MRTGSEPELFAGWTRTIKLNLNDFLDPQHKNNLTFTFVLVNKLRL